MITDNKGLQQKLTSIVQLNQKKYVDGTWNAL